MAQYKLYTGGPYKQNNGSAITSTSTDITVGAAKSVRDSLNLNRTENSTQEASVPNVVVGVDGTASADVETITTIDSFAVTSDGLVQCVFGSAHSLIVGDVIRIDDTTLPKDAYRVIRVVDSVNVVINELSSSDIESLTSIAATKQKGVVGEQGVENFIMQKNDATVHGQTSSAPLTSGSSDYGRSKVHKTNAVRTRKVATAIRQGKYDFVSGEFDAGYPAEANDFASMDTDASDVPDDESKSATGKREVGGEMTYRVGATPTTAEYDAKTT